MKIKSLEISLFKGFKKSRLEFSEGLNLLVGANNSGKSSLLQAIYLAFHFLSVTNGVSEKDKKSKDKLKGVMLKSFPLPLHDEASISEGLKKRSLRGNKSTYLKVGLFDNNISFMEGLTFPGGNPLIISSDNEGQAGTDRYRNDILKKVVKKELPLFIPIFAGVINKEEIKTKEVINYYVASGKSSEVLRNQLKEMPEKSLKLLNEYLKDSFNVEILANRTEEIYLSSIYKEGEHSNLDISLAGSGFQQILQILVYIVTSQSDIILIDEPDAHLHHKLQKVLYDILTKLVVSGKQIIVATHSQVFIKQAVEMNNHLIIVNKKLEDQKSINEYTNPLKMLYEEGLLDEEDITERNEVKLVFLEDSDSSEGFKVAKALLDKVRSKSLNYKVSSSEGKLGPIIHYLKEARRLDGLKFRALIIKDSDSLPEEYLNRLKAKYEDKDVRINFLGANEIENYLINSKAICKMINKSINGSKIAELDIRNLIQTVVSDNKDHLCDEVLDYSLEGKLKEHCRDIDLSISDVQSKTREIRNDIKNKHFVYPFDKLPGKEMFRMVKEEIRKKYNVVISETDMIPYFDVSDIPETFEEGVKFLD